MLKPGNRSHLVLLVLQAATGFPAKGSRIMSTTVTAEQFLARSIRLATANVLNSGGPFGAMIVTADGRAFDGVNRVTADNDPTAHAEVTASRTACRELGTFDLSGAVLYTSCEPCPMCLASALWARVEKVVFAADRHDAASVGFDDAVFYEYFDNQDRDSLMPVSKLVLDDPAAPAPLEPFNTWNTLDTRIDY
jgi:guanine deaminase